MNEENSAIDNDEILKPVVHSWLKDLPENHFIMVRLRALWTDNPEMQGPRYFPYDVLPKGDTAEKVLAVRSRGRTPVVVMLMDETPERIAVMSIATPSAEVKLVTDKIQGERERVRQTLKRLEGSIEATKIALRQLEENGIPFDPGAIQAIAHTAMDLATAMTRLRTVEEFFARKDEP